MCFNKEVSLVSFLFVFIVSIKCFLSNDNFLGVTLLLICLMQFLEFFLWIFLKNTKINYIITFFVPVLLTLQVTLSLFYADSSVSEELKENNKAYRYTAWITVILYVFAMGILLFYDYWKYPMKDLISVRSPKTCKLIWGFNRISPISYFLVLLAYVGYFVPFSYAFYITDNFDIYIISLIALVITMMFCWYNGASVFQSFESFWCFLVNMIAMYIIVLRMNDTIQEPTWITTP